MKRQILLLYGGESTEHEVSVVSAGNVYAALDQDKFDVKLGYIDRNGRWWLVNSVDAEPTGEGELRPLLGQAAFSVGDSVSEFNGAETIEPDVILAVLHGKNGEDGSVQALAQLLHIPIVGCDMTASAISMAKRHAKRIMQAAGINVVPFVVHHVKDGGLSYDDLKEFLGASLFVKPDGAGSSVGVSKVTDQRTLDEAIDEAHKHGEFILIEKGLNHPRELEVAVLGNLPDIKASAPAEVRPSGEFYSYDSKYDSSSTSEVIIPAEIPEDLTENVRNQALAVYELLGCAGLARVDFFFDGKELYFNEINTIPGFTNISVYPKAWANEGLSYDELVNQLIELAL